jgi:PglZ domain-containing protein
MTSWRDHILAHFAPQTSRLTLVADPDGLLVEEGIVNAIRALGFDLIPFDDPVAFRFAYESQYRQRWDRGENTELVVVLRAEEDDLRSLPFDLLQAGRRLPTFRLANIFPKLSNPIIQALDRSLLEPLYAAYESYDGGELGDRGTKDYVLRKVFKLAPDLVATSPELLRLLCEKHTRAERFPSVLDGHLAEILGASGAFAAWPLATILGDRDAFLRLLQERWPQFLSNVAAPGSVTLLPPVVPFEEARVYIDTMFLDGALHPVPFEHPEKLPEWARVGIMADPVAAARRRLTALLGRLEQEVPSGNATYRDWQQFAWRWAELLVLRTGVPGALEPAPGMRIEGLHDTVERTFADWMVSRFGSLANLVERDGRPVMVHHIARHLADRRISAGESRLALIVVDGLAIDQWLVIRAELLRAAPALRMEEAAVFAWVPTVTSVSRQAIFAGEIPLLFGDSLATTAKEESHWRRVWEEFDVPALSIGYRKGLGSAGGAGIDDLAEHPKMQVLGLVINTIDDIMHGMMLGTIGMHENVELWAAQGYLARLLERLLAAGFAVYLTADHGNIEAVGQGRPREGSLVETRGGRARVYESDLFRERVRKEFPETVLWPGAGLPPDAKALLAAGRTAFVSKGDRPVAHGGIAIEEVLVPFVRFWRE